MFIPFDHLGTYCGKDQTTSIAASSYPGFRLLPASTKLFGSTVPRFHGGHTWGSESQTLPGCFALSRSPSLGGVGIDIIVLPARSVNVHLFHFTSHLRLRQTKQICLPHRSCHYNEKNSSTFKGEKDYLLPHRSCFHYLNNILSTHLLVCWYVGPSQWSQKIQEEAEDCEDREDREGDSGIY